MTMKDIYIKATPRDDAKAIYKPKFAAINNTVTIGGHGRDRASNSKTIHGRDVFITRYLQRQRLWPYPPFEFFRLVPHLALRLAPLPVPHLALRPGYAHHLQRLSRS